MKDPVKFFDSFGKRVWPGDRVEILTHYNFRHLNGRIATVFWDSKVGVMKWTFQDTRHGRVFQTTEDFYGVHQFKRIPGIPHADNKPKLKP